MSGNVNIETAEGGTAENWRSEREKPDCWNLGLAERSAARRILASALARNDAEAPSTNGMLIGNADETS